MQLGTGYDQKEKISYNGNPASYIWAGVMKKIHSDLPKAQFKKPDKVVSKSICMDSGCLATESCTRVYTEYFVEGTLPPKCEGHEHVKICTDTNCIANEFCPHVEDRIFLQKPEKEKNATWKTNDGGKYGHISNVCTVHTAPVVKIVKVANVVGVAEADAKRILQESGLSVVIKYVENSMKNNGIVLRQSISANEEVEEGTSIELTVNKRQEEKPTSQDGKDKTKEDEEHTEPVTPNPDSEQ